jgi:thiol-disulfide isomerase/thioredoxin
MKLFTFLTFLLLLISGCVEKQQTIKPVIKQATKVDVAPKQPAVKEAVTKQTPTIKQTPITKQKTPTQRAVTKAPIITAPTPEDSATAMSLKTLNGSVIKVNPNGYNMEFISPEYRGKNVMFFLFGYDCPHCKTEIPTIKQLAKNPNLKIIGIHAKSMIGDVALRRFVKNKAFNFDVLSFSDDIKMIRFLKDYDFYDGNVPCNVLVHKDGTIETVTVSNVLSKL